MPLPPEDEVRAAVKIVEDHAARVYTWNYERSRPQLVTLYNKAMASQWNSVTDLDWSTEVDPERLVEPGSAGMQIIRSAAAAPGSPIAAWTDKEFTALGVEMFKANISQFMHGEQGAMMVAAKIVETVPWIDAKYYASTQTMDEARHTEVFAKYLETKVGSAYPMSPFLEAQIMALIEDSRWDIAYLGMQIVIESLALAAFGDMLRRTTEPLLKKLLRYIMSDEARHVAFGVLSLKEYYSELSDGELKDRQEFLLENTLRNRARSTTPEILGTDGRESRGGDPVHCGGRLEDEGEPVRGLPARLLRQARPERAQARSARCQQRVLARAVGRRRTPRIRVRRRHGHRLRVVRRGRPRSGLPRGGSLLDEPPRRP